MVKDNVSVIPHWIDSLTLRTIDPDRQAGVAMASVPLPEQDHALVAFRGMPCQVVPVAWFPAERGGPGKPRQVLVMGLADGAPDTLGLVAAEAGAVVAAQPAAAPAADAAWAGPSWRSVIIEEKKTGTMMREVNELVIGHAGRQLGIRMGIELADGGFHWWEFLQIEQLWSGPVCTAIRAAGYVGVTEVCEDEMFDPGRYNAGYWLHRHNWLHVEVYAQIFANGLVKITARHINNRFFDQGRDLEGFVPVIAFNAGGEAPADTALDGTCTDFTLGDVQLDIDRNADLISPEHPGRLRAEDDLIIYQPYEGVEWLLGDGEPADRWRVEASERRMWKGMGRSVGFDLSFAPAPIRTRRYLPPYGWLGYTGALWPDAVLPARGPLDETCDEILNSSHRASEPAGSKPFCSGRFFQDSAMWDGERAHGLMRQAYRTGRREVYEAALHHAYAFADAGIDHADFTQQIGGMTRGSISLVLQRNLGMLAAYLETGDPYLLRMAESMADTAYAIDRSNWPRRSYGRDSAYIRSMTRLYDVTGQAFYLQRAGEACRRVTQCQRPEGCFGDQGATSGAHAHLSEIIKPWMNSILSEVFVDYLERAGSDPVVEACLLKTADWLLSQLLEDEDGLYWPYQVAWGKNVEDPTTRWRPGATPVMHPTGDVQLDYNARIMLWVSRRTGDPKYARAWQQTYQRRLRQQARTGKPYFSTYGEVKVPDNFPWHESHLWGARWDGAGVSFTPDLGLLEVGREATIELPDGGSVRVRRTEAGVEIIG
ncbi:MAG: hypothetical protein ACYDCO_25045 [Armatimonadota bacterium]